MVSLLRFFFPVEIGRLSFFLRALVTESGLILLVMAFIDLPGEKGALAEGAGIVTACLVLFVYRAIWVLMPRIRDLDLPSWTLLLTFVPVISGMLAVHLLFSAGDRFQRVARRHGQSSFSGQEVREDSTA